MYIIKGGVIFSLFRLLSKHPYNTITTVQPVNGSTVEKAMGLRRNGVDGQLAKGGGLPDFLPHRAEIGGGA